MVGPPCLLSISSELFLSCMCMWAKIQVWCRRQELIASDQPNWMQLQRKALTENVSCQRAPPPSKWHLYTSCPVLQQGFQWPAIDFFFLSIMSLQPGSLSSSEMQILLALLLLPLQRLLSKYMHTILQVLSAKVFGWDFSKGSVSILAA